MSAPRNSDPNYHRAEPTEEELFRQTAAESKFNFDHFDCKTFLSGKGKEKYNAVVKRFDELVLNEVLLTNVKKCKYQQLTPAQRLALPILLDGRDIVLAAQTGSGKTAAFLLPILQQLMSAELQCESNQPSALILSPTRELCTQIYDEARKFAANTGLHVCVAYGGVRTRAQAERIQSGCDILVATPGRLTAFLQENVVDLSCCQFVVLDEADELLDLGFQNQLNEISQYLPEQSNRTTAMFSATISEKVQGLGQAYLQDNYIFARVAPPDSVPTGIKQELWNSKDQFQDVCQILTEMRGKRVLLFVKTKNDAREWEQQLSRFRSAAIHGDKSQQDREIALQRFKANELGVLVATDVAARGLDIPHVEAVIQIGVPQDITTYIHRIGRTGRKGMDGRAITLYDGKGGHKIPEIVNVMEHNGSVVPPWARNVRGDPRRSRSEPRQRPSSGNFRDRPPPRGGHPGGRGGGAGGRRGGGGRGGGGRGGGRGGGCGFQDRGRAPDRQPFGGARSRTAPVRSQSSGPFRR